MNVGELLSKCLRAVTPPIITRSIGRLFFRPSSVFHGPFSSWDDAVAASDGWDSDEIVEKVFRSMTAVRDGQAIFERDSIVYERILYSPTILAFLLLSLSSSTTVLNIVDYGGSLGSNYHQNRRILRGLKARGVRIVWNVVEQPRFVALGRQHFANEDLSFHDRFEDCLDGGVPPAVIFTGSFQCLPQPWDLVARMIAAGVRLLAFDRLIVGPKSEHGVYVQVPPPRIYRSTFPVWMFSKSRFLSYFAERQFELVDYLSEHPDQPFEHCGMIFLRNERNVTTPGGA